MSPLQRALTRLSADLDALGLRWAVVGGFAVSARSEPRTTRDIDVAVSIADDAQAEEVVRRLVGRSYRIDRQMEHTETARLATIRLLTPGELPGGIVVDLLFASSGIESEVVAAAERIEILPDLWTPVARTAHLLALKVLAGRTRDKVDVEHLLEVATTDDLREARRSLVLITERDFHRGKDLLQDFWALTSG